MTPAAVVHRERARILLAEDDEPFRTLLSTLLREDGFDVVEAPDGRSLLEQVAEAIRPDGALPDFDLIVSDVRLPGYTGLDVLTGLAELRVSTPVVLISAFADDRLHQLASSLGAAEVFDKPFDVDDLRARVCTILSQHAQRS